MDLNKIGVHFLLTYYKFKAAKLCPNKTNAMLLQSGNLCMQFPVFLAIKVAHRIIRGSILDYLLS
jgi:hypothetical protein